MRLVKNILSVSLAVTMVLAFASCSKKIEYKNDVAVTTLADSVKKTIPLNDGYITADTDYIEFNFKDMPSPDESVILMAANSSSNINEIGIFKANGYGAKGENILKSAEQYIKTKAENSRAFVESYAPAECKKLDEAQCKVFGDYIVYTVLTKEDASKVFDAFEKALKK